MEGGGSGWDDGRRGAAGLWSPSPGAFEGCGVSARLTQWPVEDCTRRPEPRPEAKRKAARSLIEPGKRERYT
jgi:hypothetical protein